jgi:hypothetical protein
VVVIGALVLGCSDAELGGGAQDAATSAIDAAVPAPRMKERTVRLELGKVAHRELLEGDGGTLVYGEVTYLAGAEVCVISRRDAFRAFEPFEALDPPICVTSADDESLWLEPVPANSDILITATKPGYEPALRPHRTDDRDVPLPAWAVKLMLPLLAPEEAAPWIEEPQPAATGESGRLMLDASMFGNADAAPATNFWFPAPLHIARTNDVRFSIEAVGGGEPIELTSLADRPRFLALPAGTYRLQFTHDRARCQPSGVSWGLGFSLFTDELHTVEVRILAGHATGFSVDCYCVDEVRNEQIADLGTCTLVDAGTAGL